MGDKSKRRLDDIVIIVTVGLSFISAIVFAVMMSDGKFFPPTLLAILLGISISALTYRFLGGTDGTKFSVGLLGLGGSAALLLGTTWFVGDRLKSEFKIYDEFKSYVEEIKRLEKQLTMREKRQEESDLKISTLEEKIRNVPSMQNEFNLAYVKNLKPGDVLVTSLKHMVRSGESPFNDTLKNMQARIAVVGNIGDRLKYNICRDTYQRIYQDLPSDTHLRFSRSKGADSEPVSETLDRDGFIDDDVCTSSTRQFDAQIGCSVAMRLFADKVVSCAETGILRGATITLSALPST